MRSRVLFVLCVAMGLAPSLAFADWADFIPRPFENGAYLDTFSSYERDDSRSGNRSIRWNDTFIREKLTLYSNGYSYHPRFLQYQFSIAGLAKEEDFEANYLEPLGWRYGSSMEYDVRLFLLPEHSYNLRLFASRYEPLFKEQAALQHNAVEDSRGASFRYRKKPYFFHASYVNDTIESAEASSDVTRFGVDAEYFKRFKSGNEFSVNGAFNPAWFSTSDGLDGSSMEYLAGNFVNLQWARLSSSVSQNSFDQRDNSGQKFTNDQFAWYEVLTGYLPWNFRTDVSYRYQDNKGTTQDASGEPARDLSEIGRDIQFDLVHRLYESLDTTYTLLRDSRTSSDGETTALSHALAVNYAKSIPRGRILIGVNGATSQTDNSGQGEVIDEPHSGIFIPGTFPLAQQNVQAGSIIVSLKCTTQESCPPPLVVNQRVPLTENVDYRVFPVLNGVEIQIVSLPLPLVVPGTYDFLVSYSLAAGDFSLESDTVGSNASVQLFNDLLTPYFSYVVVKSKVLSGVFPGIPIDSKTYTTGLLIHYGPLRLRGEYQELQWDVSPYRAWRADVQYVAALTPTTNAYATAGYLNRYYPQGTSGFANTSGAVGVTGATGTAFTEETESASGSIQKQLWRNMSLSVGGSYSHLHGLIDGNAYSLNSAFVWTIGKVDLSLGANAYASDTSGTNTVATRRDHELFFLKLRRQLF